MSKRWYSNHGQSQSVTQVQSVIEALSMMEWKDSPSLCRVFATLSKVSTSGPTATEAAKCAHIQVLYNYQSCSHCSPTLCAIHAPVYGGTSKTRRMNSYLMGCQQGRPRMRPISNLRDTHMPNMIAALGTTRNRCGVRPPYIDASPSSLQMVRKHCTRPVYLSCPFSIGASRSRVRTTFQLSSA